MKKYLACSILAATAHAVNICASNTSASDDCNVTLSAGAPKSTVYNTYQEGDSSVGNEIPGGKIETIDVSAISETEVKDIAPVLGSSSTEVTPPVESAPSTAYDYTDASVVSSTN